MFADLSHPHVSLSLVGMLDISNFFTNDWQFAINDLLSLVEMSSYSLLSRTTINFKKPVFWCQTQWPTRASINSSTKLFSLCSHSFFNWLINLSMDTPLILSYNCQFESLDIPPFCIKSACVLGHWQWTILLSVLSYPPIDFWLIYDQTWNVVTWL